VPRTLPVVRCPHAKDGSIATSNSPNQMWAQRHLTFIRILQAKRGFSR
jgi:hypothetical protein